MANSVASVCSDMENNDICVVECRLSGGPSLCLERGRMVAYDEKRLETERNKCTALMHEHGHFLSGAFYYPYSPYQVMEKCEYRANKSAALKYIPVNDLKQKIAEGLSVYELAEYFNVNQEFIWTVYTIYHENMGIDFACETDESL